MLVHGSSPAYQPAAFGRSDSRCSGLDRHKGHAARTEQPLVTCAHHEVESAGIDRQPTASLGGVEQQLCTGAVAGREQPVQVGDQAIRRLHGTDRDQVPLAGGVGDLVSRTLSTVSPAACANGNSTDVKSPSAVSTRAPAGSDAATRPTNCETAAPAATSETSTPDSCAQAARLRSTSSSKSGAWRCPRRQQIEGSLDRGQAGPRRGAEGGAVEEARLDVEASPDLWHHARNSRPGRRSLDRDGS